MQESGEMYLETILRLSKQQPMVRAIDVSEYMNYSKPSISVAVKNLCTDGYLVMDEDKHLRLTEAGRAVAERIYDRHRTLEAVLTALGVDRAQAEKDACKIEHDLSDESYEAIKSCWKKMLASSDLE